jgi:hypothetical protein
MQGRQGQLDLIGELVQPPEGFYITSHLSKKITDISNSDIPSYQL